MNQYSFEKYVEQPNVRNDYVFVDFVKISCWEETLSFILKEFCLVDGDYQYHQIIQSPYELKSFGPDTQKAIEWDISSFGGI